jgi:hypothetical protein
MASPTPHRFPFYDDRPSGSVRPLSRADLEAILAHLPGGLAAGPSGRMGRLGPEPALAGRRPPRHRCRWRGP